MGIDAATRTVLEKNPGLRRKDLLFKVERLTGTGKSSICDEWASLVLRGELYREKGRYWNKKPSEPRKLRRKVVTVSHPLTASEALQMIDEYRKSGIDLEIQVAKKSMVGKLKDFVGTKIDVP